jgi:hypothetical protein
MAQLRELNLVIDVESKKLISSFASTQQGSLPTFAFGDSVPVAIRFVKASRASPPFEEVDLTNQTARIAIGTPAGNPTAGTFTLTYGASTTSAIAYNASASAIQTALNALASIIAAGGVTVTANNGIIRIVFSNVGARTDITANVSDLYPTSSAKTARAQTGDGTKQEIVVVAFETQPAAYAELSDDFDPATVVVATVRNGESGVGEIQTITLYPEPYGGSYTLTVGADTTPAIPWDATASEVQGALEGIATLTGKVVVSGGFPAFTLSFDTSLENIGASAGDATGLIVPTGKRGTLNLNVAGIIELLNGESSTTSPTFEAELFDSSTESPWTVLQMPCTVIEDLIPNEPTEPTPLPTFADWGDGRYLKHSAAQTLNTTGRSQALSNLGIGHVDSGLKIVFDTDGQPWLAIRNLDTGTFKPVAISGAGAAESLVVLDPALAPFV